MSVHLFIDTNIIIDFLSDRKPFSTTATALFERAARKTVRLYIAAITYNNTYYILRKHLPHKTCISTLKNLTQLAEIVDTDAQIIHAALDSRFGDFEDAIQYYTAYSMGTMAAIITRNPKDFKSSEIPVWSPEQAVAFLDNQHLA
jgi:predicted nucleic acid-binding protein